MPVASYLHDVFIVELWLVIFSPTSPPPDLRWELPWFLIRRFPQLLLRCQWHIKKLHLFMKRFQSGCFKFHTHFRISMSKYEVFKLTMIAMTTRINFHWTRFLFLSIISPYNIYVSFIIFTNPPSIPSISPTSLTAMIILRKIILITNAYINHRLNIEIMY